MTEECEDSLYIWGIWLKIYGKENGIKNTIYDFQKHKRYLPT